MKTAMPLIAGALALGAALAFALAFGTAGGATDAIGAPRKADREAVVGYGSNAAVSTVAKTVQPVR